MSARGLLVGFILLLYTAVLSFGGTDTLVLPVIQAGIFVVTLAGVWHFRQDSLLQGSVLPWILLIVAFVVLQWLLLAESRSAIQLQFPRLLAYLCAFYLAYLFGQERRLRRALVVALLALGVLEALYGLAQYLLNWPYVLTYKNIFYASRATGTYINPNHFAGFLEMVLPLALGLTLYGLDHLRGVTSRGLERLGADSERAPRLIFYFFFSLLLFVGILYSRSRLGIFAALAAVVAVLLLWVSASWRRARAMLVLLVFLVGAAAMGLWLGLEPVIERYGAIESAYLARVAIWQDTLPLIGERPLLGWGLGSFADAYTKHQTTALTRFVDHAHNDYLQFAAELGLIGVVLLFGLILAGLARMVDGINRMGRTRDRYLLLGCAGGVIAILFHSLAEFNLQIPANALVFATILGLGLGIRNSAVTELNQARRGEPTQGEI